MRQGLSEQALKAYKDSGLTQVEFLRLLAKHGHPLDPATLSRWVNGSGPRHADWCQWFADTLGITLIWDGSRGRRSRAA